MLRRLRQLFFTPPDSTALRKDALARYGDIIDIPADVRLENFELEIRVPSPGRKRFTVGQGCVLSGRFVLEAERSEINIGADTFIGGGLFIALEKIDIGSDVMISWGCTVTDNDAHSLLSYERQEDVKNWKKDLEAGHTGKSKNWSTVKCVPVSIGNKSWIGFNSIILKGVRLEPGCVVGAGSVVTGCFESNTVVAGNPARSIKKTE